MNETKNIILADLKLFIDVSCEDCERQHLFNDFHNMLIRMHFKATKVLIDYKAKIVYMDILAEHEFYDAEVNNEFAATMSTQLEFEEFRTFLNSCIIKDAEILIQYYPFLRMSFFKRKSKKAVFKNFELVH